jgi:hypothetical protein
MSCATKSEQLFVEFCKSHDVLPVRLPECDGQKQPDYEVSFNRQKVVFEIKQIEPNEADKKFNAALETVGMASQTRNPDKVANRVRDGIKEGRRQIRSYLQNNPAIPAVVIFYDNANNRYTDPYTIQTAMYGWEQVSFNVPSNGQSPRVVERGFGPRNNKAIRPDKNEQISAIATLHETWDVITKERLLSLCFFHNGYAIHSFNPLWWSGNNIFHFTLEDKVQGQFQRWKLLSK